MAKGLNPRSRWEIVLNILDVIVREKKRAKKTRIMKMAYLDWRNFHRHFGFLTQAGFVKEIDDPSVGVYYELTKKGTELREKLKEVELILSE
jgi:predicted transcriptional regulator